MNAHWGSRSGDFFAPLTPKISIYFLWIGLISWHFRLRYWYSSPISVTLWLTFAATYRRIVSIHISQTFVHLLTFLEFVAHISPKFTEIDPRYL